jgi:hypothetical protein
MEPDISEPPGFAQSANYKSIASRRLLVISFACGTGVYHYHIRVAVDLLFTNYRSIMAFPLHPSRRIPGKHLDGYSAIDMPINFSFVVNISYLFNIYKNKQDFTWSGTGKVLRMNR